MFSMLPILPDAAIEAVYKYLDSVDPLTTKKVDFPVVIKLPSGEQKQVANVHFESVDGKWHAFTGMQAQSEVEELIKNQQTRIEELKNQPF